MVRIFSIVSMITAGAAQAQTLLVGDGRVSSTPQVDDAGLDAAAHEVQDLCSGHPQGKGQYHYHNASPCMDRAEANAAIGWALDDYPILGMRDATGRLLANADLDACHGRAEIVAVAGLTYDYAYRLTAEYPYAIGCFTGQVLESTARAIRATMGPPRRR